MKRSQKFHDKTYSMVKNALRTMGWCLVVGMVGWLAIDNFFGDHWGIFWLRGYFTATLMYLIVITSIIGFIILCNTILGYIDEDPPRPQ